MRVGEQNRSVALSVLVDAGMLLAGLALAVSIAGSPHGKVQASSGEGGGVTHLRVTGQVILPGVTRLGINLGEQTYYDSGQMMRNLLYRNPGFEGMAYRSILHCLLSGPSNCTDTRHSFTWPAGSGMGPALKCWTARRWGAGRRKGQAGRAAADMG
jgi:hypothetical protein